MTLTYNSTKLACYMGLVTQSIVNSMPPLLYATFETRLDISLAQLSILIMLNFTIQLLIDALCTKFVDKAGFRVSAVMCHACAIVGIAGIGLFPLIMPAYPGLIAAVAVSAVGGGFLEVIVNPIIESVPGDNKAASMSLLHSFFCWGCAVVILGTTLFLNFTNGENWYLIPVVWSVIPLFNMILFTKVPLSKSGTEHSAKGGSALFRSSVFWLFLVLMLCSGAAEQSMSQWASLFAETGLRVSKTMGDLLGPFAFAILMGMSRVLFAKCQAENLQRTMLVCGIGCLLSYFTVVFAPYPIVSLTGCALCGFFVGPMWPGSVSLSAARFPAGGTFMFALLALGGDLGCAAGPTVAGLVSDGIISSSVQNIGDSANFTEIGLKSGILASSAFCLVLVLVLIFLKRKRPAALR